MLLVSAGVLIPRLLPQLPTLPLPLIAPLVAPTDSTYWLTRSWFLRGLGGIFSIAFSVALIQNKALIGDQVRGTRAASFWDKIYTPWTIDNEHGNSNGICCNG